MLRDRLLDAAIAGLRVVCRATKHRDPVTYFLAGEAQNRLKGWRG